MNIDADPLEQEMLSNPRIVELLEEALGKDFRKDPLYQNHFRPAVCAARGATPIHLAFADLRTQISTRDRRVSELLAELTTLHPNHARAQRAGVEIVRRLLHAGLTFELCEMLADINPYAPVMQGHWVSVKIQLSCALTEHAKRAA